VSYSKLKQMRFYCTVCNIILWKIGCFLLPPFLSRGLTNDPIHKFNHIFSPYSFTGYGGSWLPAFRFSQSWICIVQKLWLLATDGSLGLQALVKAKFSPPHTPDRPWATQPPVNWKIVLFPEGKAAGGCLSQPTPV
jgi:hypothetical protein